MHVFPLPTDNEVIRIDAEMFKFAFYLTFLGGEEDSIFTYTLYLITLSIGTIGVLFLYK